MAPLVRAWATSATARRLTAPRPQDAPVARGAGPDPDRILMIGDGVLVGWGVRTHDLGLLGHLARILAARTGHGVDVQARIDPEVTVGGLGALVDGLRLWRYDAVVVVLGTAHAASMVPERRWSRELGTLIDRVQAEGSACTEILVTGIRPVSSTSIFTGWPVRLADRHANRLNHLTRELCAARERTTYVPIPAPSGPPGAAGSRAPTAYREWAEAIATPLASRLAQTRTDDQHRRDDGPDPEPERQRAVDDLGAAALAGDARLDRLARLARDLYSTRLAAVTLIDGDRHVNLGRAGFDDEWMPRRYSMCDQTIRDDGTTVFADMWAEPRFDDNPGVHGDAPLRFYAGHPLESPDGYRIGSLCVLDPEPRAEGEVDPGPLRELALLAQKELWDGARDPQGT